MTTLEKVRAVAQREADRTGKPLVILNLNPCNPLYVVRNWVPMMGIPTYAAKQGLVERVDPKSEVGIYNGKP